MSMSPLIDAGIAQAITVLRSQGLVMDVRVAAAQAFDPQPGEDYAPTWAVHTGVGVWDKGALIQDYPNTEISTEDRSLLLMQCAHDVIEHEFVLVDDQSYHVYSVKPEFAGSKRVLQKLLVRPEPKGIAWDSLDPSEA